MKKFRFLSCLLLVLSAMGILSSCTKEKFNFKDMYMTYNYSINQEILDIANIEVTYKDFEGNEKTETISSTRWSASFYTKTIPASCAIKVKVSLKEGVTLKKSEYAIKREFSYTLQEHYTNGLDGWSKTGMKTTDTKKSKAEIESALSRLGQNNTFSITPGTEGSYIVSE